VAGTLQSQFLHPVLQEQRGEVQQRTVTVGRDREHRIHEERLRKLALFRLVNSRL